jgi:hypothetical protein
MKLALISAFLIAIGATAQAKDRHLCMSLEKAQKNAGMRTSLIPMSRAQFHFLQGLYVGLPSTPNGLPPGDGALIIKSDSDDSGIIVWTRGPLACDPIALPQAGKLLKYLAEIKAGMADGSDDL